jgi:hypothetical protein
LVISIFLAVLVSRPLRAAQQSSPQLQITTPVNGSIVNPGQTISITVTSPANVNFTSVGIAGESPVGFSNVVTSVPAQFSMPVPTGIACRRYMLTAVGATASGQSAQSPTILIDVERPDMPVSLSTLLPGVSFEVIGEKSPMIVLATFSDGSILDVTRSSNITYSSSDATIATVGANGIATAVAPGRAFVTATYAQGAQNVQVSVPVTVPPQVLAPSAVSLSFGSQNVGTSSTPQQLTLTNAGNGPLRIISLSTTGDFSETDNCTPSSPLAVSGTCTANVTFTPTAAGSRAGGLSIANGANIIPAIIPLSGNGIGQQPTAATIASSANPSVYGQSVVLTTTVAPSAGSGTPTGSVTFDDGANPLSSVALSGGQGTFTDFSLTVGTHSITAAYGGDANFLPNASSALSQVVNQASTATTLTSSANPSTLNSSVTLTASFSVVAPGAGTPTGSITFQDGSNVLATVPVGTSGQATFSSATLAAGSHPLTASYGGDTNFKVSSGTFSQQVAYGICVLYDQTRSVNSGATFPIKVYLCDVNGNDVSSSSIVLHATGITNVSGFAGPVQSPGNANPDNDFRFDSTLGPSGGYIFNLGTAGLATGTYSLHFTAGVDPISHVVSFGVQ